MKYLVSTFSLQMVEGKTEIRISPEREEDIKYILFSVENEKGALAKYGGCFLSPKWDYVSLGHPGTVDALNGLFERWGAAKRISLERKFISLKAGDSLIVCQPTGRRLDVGEEIALPELNWFLVEVLFPRPAPRGLDDFWDDEISFEHEKRGLGMSYDEREALGFRNPE